jgi:hypothetical protein
MLRFDRLRVSLLTAIAACGKASSDAETETGSSSTTGDETTTVTSDATDSTDATDSSDSTETGGCEDLCGASEPAADGYVRCADGSINRVGPGTYEPIVAGNCAGTEDILNCTTDADCNAAPYGACVSGFFFEATEEYTRCSCSYGCASDEECDPGYVCVPPGLVGGTPAWPSCQPATCLTDEDCGPCGECGLGGYHDNCSPVVRQNCRSAEDGCRTDQDCDLWCDPNSPWSCNEFGCQPGRPLLVAAQPRTAELRNRADWSIPAKLERDEELARYWARIAAIEHASVASFARFAIQLLSLGAPPEFVRASQRAAIDEVRHAQLAYGLASAYAGAPVGPGRLDLDGVELRGSWREIVAGLIEEACVNETLGVAEAIAALDAVEEPAVRAVLEIIAADEQRHAQLAWRCLAWLLRTAKAEDRRWALSLLDASIATPRIASGGVDRPAAGVLGGARRASAHRRAITQVLEPVARALAAA